MASLVSDFRDVRHVYAASLSHVLPEHEDDGFITSLTHHHLRYSQGHTLTPRYDLKTLYRRETPSTISTDLLEDTARLTTLDERWATMPVTHSMRSPNYAAGGSSMIVSTPNPRRSSARPTDTRIVDGRRKRQKLGHCPEKELHRQSSKAIGDEVPGPRRVLPSQEQSCSSDYSASKWFDKANQNIPVDQGRPQEAEDDPPFYMSNRAPYIPTYLNASSSGGPFGGGRGAVSRMDSENEDLRGVIDDLTVENKRLRQLMRSRQREPRSSSRETPQLQDKLFEVRMHGLPPEKRRELEALLKNFATNVHVTPSLKTSTSNGSASTSGGYASVQHSQGVPQTDSGYGSNSTSSLSHSTPTSGSFRKSTNKAVRNYLKDIPDTLLPKRTPVMSEPAKQGLVVRRLEQLFTGRSAMPGVHSQPIQQQEISQSAARADRLQDATDNKRRNAEGTREARIMPQDSKVNLDLIDDGESTSPMKSRSASGSMVASRPASPDQRPTRPLDLDINRAQVASENFSYLAHLGLNPPQFGSLTDGEDGPWMWLNLLAGLAQLHTLNVTTDYVRKAIKKYSKHLELSKDGHRVRWVGGPTETRFAVEDERAIDTAAVSREEHIEESNRGGSSNRSKADSESNAVTTSNTPSDDKISGLPTVSSSKQHQGITSATSNLQSSTYPTTQMTTSSTFGYKPMFYRQKPKIDFDDCFQDSDESFDSQSGDSSGLVAALSKSNLNQKKQEEGMLTFFNNAYFCIDLSVEQTPSNMMHSRHVVVGETLGVSVPDVAPESPLRHHDATYFTTQFAPKPFDVDVLSNAEKKKFYNSLPRFTGLETITEAGEDETMPLDMEVCGLGGVTPEDNFVLDVKIERKLAPSRGPNAVVRTLPFSYRRYFAKYIASVAECRKVDLLPSKLPPPSYIFFTSGSSSNSPGIDEDSEEEEDDDDTSESSSSPCIDEEYPAPPAFLRQFSGSSGENVGDDEDDDTSSVIDMLAIARQANPVAIAEQERVYMMNQPRGAQDVVAGSLAVTLGESRTTSSIKDAPALSSAASTSGSLDVERDDEDGDEDMGDTDDL